MIKKTFSKAARLQMFFKIGVLKNYAIFTGKHLCWSYFLIKLQAGHILDLYCVRLSNAAPFCKNYAKLYFDAKHLEKGLNRRVNILGSVFHIKVSFMANIEGCPKFIEYAQAGLEACNFIKERIQRRRFLVNIATYLRTPILKNIRERLLLYF